MRDLKFRAWDKEKKRMLLWGDWEQTQWIKDAMPVQEGDEWTERCILMQYIGLKDEAQKEIYEGDIVRYGTEDAVVTAQVDFAEEDSETTMFLTGFHMTVINSADYPEDEEDNDFAFEVIGNIYDNPELLQ